MQRNADDVLPDLYQVIAENAPDAIKSGEIKNHFGRKVAIVCSTKWAQFLLLCRELSGY